jgi:hypothetical protein
MIPKRRFKTPEAQKRVTAVVEIPVEVIPGVVTLAEATLGEDTQAGAILAGATPVVVTLTLAEATPAPADPTGVKVVVGATRKLTKSFSS